MCLDRVLDRELVQVELARHRGETPPYSARRGRARRRRLRSDRPARNSAKSAGSAVRRPSRYTAWSTIMRSTLSPSSRVRTNDGGPNERTYHSPCSATSECPGLCASHSTEQSSPDVLDGKVATRAEPGLVMAIRSCRRRERRATARGARPASMHSDPIEAMIAALSPLGRCELEASLQADLAQVSTAAERRVAELGALAEMLNPASRTRLGALDDADCASEIVAPLLELGQARPTASRSTGSSAWMP
jgi:hypothetical protein